MSRLLEKIKECTSAEAQPMGFGAARRASRLCPVLIARLASDSIGSLKERLDGADAIIAPAGALKKMKDAAPEAIWGGWLAGEAGDEAGDAAEAGGDFLVFHAEQTPLTLLENKDAGRVMLADVSAEGGLLRAISGVPADAVLAGGEPLEGNSLSWQKLLYLQRLADFVKQPLLAPVPLDITEKELETLWGSGVVGMVVELTGREAADSLGKLRKMLGGMDFSAGKKGKGAAVLPRLAPEPEPSKAPPTEVPEIEPEEDD